MRRCVVVAGGELRDYERAKTFLREDDFFVFCDGGLGHADGLCVTPSLIVGDFDSCKAELLEKWEGRCETIHLPCEKDDTDTLYAVKTAVNRGFEDFLILGAMGARFDHAFANVSILLFLDNIGKSALLVDDYSVMRVVGKNPVYIEDDCSYFSIMTIAGDAGGINIRGAKYPLENATLKCDYQMGVSNEVLPGHTAEVNVENGRVLVVKIF